MRHSVATAAMTLLALAGFSVWTALAAAPTNPGADGALRRYSSETTFVAVVSQEPGASGEAALAEVLDRVTTVLSAEKLIVKREGTGLVAERVSDAVAAAKQPGRLVVRVSGKPASLRAASPAAAWTVALESHAGEAIAEHPDAGVPNAHLEAEALRSKIVAALMTHLPVGEQRRDGVVDWTAGGPTLLAVPVGSSDQRAAEVLDRLVERAAGLNKRVGAEAVVVENRGPTRLALRFDVDAIFKGAPARVQKANKPVLIRLLIDIKPPNGDEKNVHASVIDLSGGELDKLPHYRKWATSTILGFIIGGP